LVDEVWSASDYDAIISILTLVDNALIISLLLIIIFSGYENFVSKIGVTHQDRPAWMGKVGFSDLPRIGGEQHGQSWGWLTLPRGRGGETAFLVEAPKPICRDLGTRSGGTMSAGRLFAFDGR